MVLAVQLDALSKLVKKHQLEPVRSTSCFITVIVRADSNIDCSEQEQERPRSVMKIHRGGSRG